MPDIFINFRKPDRSLERDRLYRSLVAAYGTDAIFKSGVSIPAGADYAEVLTEQARACKIMLVLIGPDWLAPDDYGFAPSYWDQMEIATALQAGNTVIPVLLGSTVMLPHPDELPAKIAQLGRLQFQRLSDASFEQDTAGFVERLSKVLPPAQGAAPVPQPPNGGTMNTVTLHSSTNKGTIAGRDVNLKKVTIGGGGVVAALVTTTVGRVATVAVVLGGGFGIYTATASGASDGGSLLAKLQGDWNCHEVMQTIDDSQAGSRSAVSGLTIGNGTLTVKRGEGSQDPAVVDHVTWQQSGGALIFGSPGNPKTVTVFGIPDDFGSFHTTVPETSTPDMGGGRIDVAGTTSKSRITLVFSVTGATDPTIKNGPFLSIGCARA